MRVSGKNKTISKRRVLIDTCVRGLIVSVFILALVSSVFSPPANAVDTIEWTEVTGSADWAARTDHATVVFDDRLWVIGGYVTTVGACGGAGVVCDEVWYSSDGVDWHLATDNPGWSPRNSHSAAVFNDKIWVIGGASVSGFTCGSGTQNYCGDVWSSSDGITWEKVTDVPGWGTRHSHTVTVFDGKLWLMGGYSDTTCGPLGPCKEVWSSPDGENWTLVTDDAGWGARAYHSSISFNNKLWLIGGYCYAVNDICPSEVWSSPDGENWTLATDNPGWTPRMVVGFTVLADKMWLYGGCDSACGPAKDFWSSPDGENWTLISDDPVPGGRKTWSGTGLLQSFNQRLWIIGGTGDDWEYLNDVWMSQIILPDEDNNENEPNSGNDLNGDGTPDSEQPNVTGFTSSVTGKTVVLEVDDECTINNVSMAAESAQNPADAGYDYPQGLMQFTVDCGTPGYTTTIKQYYYGVITNDFVLRKHVPDTNAYFTLTDATIAIQAIYGQQVLTASYQIADGGALDIDGVDNGVIVDPAGLAISVVGAPNTGLGGRR